MKRFFKKSLYKIFVSLFLVFYTLIPQSIAMGQVIDEYSQNNAAPAEEEVIPEESLPQKEVVLPEEIPPVVEEPLVEEMPIEEPVVEVPVVEQPIVEPKEVIKEVMSYPVWVIKGNTATTSDIVELGKTYISPQNSRVRIIFTKLPENPSTISIEEITLTQAEIEVTGAVSDKAYDIKTDMLDGTFEYDLVLPSIEEKTKVVYVEERKDIFTDVKEVNNELVNEKDIVKIEDVDHFTIFIVTGIWPTTSNDSIVSGEGTSQIRWPSGSSNQSGLGFVGVSGLDLESLTTSGDSFILGTLTHYNHPVQSSIVWSDLKITLGLPTPKDFTFRVQIDETPNTQNLSGCTSGFQLTTTPCDDKVTFPDSISDQIVTVGGIDYTLIIDGFKRTLSGTTLDSFVTEENKDNTASLVGHFVPVGRIIVDKITDPIADITSFSFTTTGAGYGAFSLSDTSTPNNQVLPANKTYSVGETLPANWAQSSVNCVSSIGDTETSTAMELDAGETITCTFTNTSTLCRAGNPSLEGKIKNGSYTTGNLCAGNGDCWSEGEDVPARITIPGMVIGKNYSVSIQHDYSLSGTIGYEYFHTALSGNGSANNISLGSATTTDCGGGVTCKDYVLSFTAQSTTVQLDWLARLSNQAGNWSGASLHYRLTVGPCGGSGNKDIPINPGEIIKLGSINVIKSTNNNAIPSEWSFNITGNTNVGNIPSGSTANNLSLGSNNGDATYTITEVGPNSDWYLDSVSGDCTKSGNNTASVVLTSSKPDVSCTFVNIKYSPLIEVVKASTTTNISISGQVVPYTFTVKNKGNQTLTEIVVTDPKCDSGPSYVSGDTNTDSKLQVSETWVYGCNHTVTQGEIDLGGNLSNTVTADSKESVPDTDTKVIPITQNPLIEVVKSSTTTSITSAGQVVPYSFTVTNEGNQTLTVISVTDPNCNVAPLYVSGDTNTDSKLQVTETWVYSCSHTVTQGEIDLGGNLSNTVTADSKESVPDTDTKVIPITQNPLIEVVKASATTNISISGQVVPYTFTVKNKGNQTLTEIVVTDPKCDSGPSYVSGDTNTDSKLQVSETWVYGCNHTVTQGEIDLGGNLSNTVTADSKESVPDTDTKVIPITQNPLIEVVKASATTNISISGQVVPYTFTVKNKGNQTLTEIVVTDPKCDSGPSYVSGDTNTDSKLQVSETWVYGCNHTVTQGEIDLGGNLSNTVTADSKESVPDTDTKVIPITQNPLIEVVKSSTTTSITSAGQVVPYSFTVTNEGNQTLTVISVTDPNCNVAPLYVSGDTNTDSKLQVTETWVYSCSHTVTQGEIDLGGNLSNTVTADSKESVPDTDTKVIPITQNPLIEVVKASATTNISISGQVVPYTFTVKNKGNQTLTEIVVTDPKCDSGPSYVSGDTNTDSKLQVSETWVYGCNHTVTQGEIDLGGNLSNTVTADSKESVPDTDTKVIPITQNPLIEVVKTANPLTYDEVGDVISYSYLVTNRGNVTLYDISVVDDKATATCPSTSIGLAPLGTITCTASYTIDLEDLDDGSVKNTAYATDGKIKSEEDDETVTSIAGKIIIQKQTLPDGSVQSFEFNPSWSTTNFELKDGEQKDSGWLVPGRYDISEINPDGWYLNNTSCISSKEDTETVDSITLDNNEIVTCTFTNYQKGSITVTKVDNINSGQDFTFNFTPLGLTSSQFVLDDDNNSNGLLSDTRTFSGLVSTFYDISEVAVAGWTSGIVSCISDNPMQHPQNSFWYGTMSVALRPGENMICTFTNTRDTGSLKVNKYTDINGDGDWSDNNEKSNSNANTLGFRWSLDSGTDNNMGVKVANVVTGSHSVDEIMPTGYHFVSWYIKGTDKSCSNPNGRTLPITLDIIKDNTKEITICNARDTGTVTIIKDAINNSEEDFYFDTNFGDLELEDDGNKYNGGTPEKKTYTIPTGSYWIDEKDESGWKLTSLECIGDDNSTINLLDGKVDIDLDYGENVTCTYTNTELAKVWGFKYNDENGNGDWNLGEWGLGNWRIFIDEGNGIYDGTEQSSLTSNHLLSLGYYEFENLLPGEYTLCEQLQTGWTNTTPFCQTINLTPGEEERFVNFANIKYGSILAHKFEDTNGDGDIDENENGLEGWQMNVYKGYGCKGDVISQYTNESGDTQFDNVVAGHYSVMETNQERWVTTSPVCQNIHVNPGQTTLVNIGNVILTDIHGFKWSDFNGNGERDCIGNGGSIEIARGTCELEPLLSDWTINLFKWNGDGYESEPFKTMDTNNSEEEYGWYWFEDLLPGKYKICEVQQDGWTQTYPINEIGNCHEITLPLESDSINTLVSLNYVAGPQYDFGNTIDPKLEIQKSNDTGGAGMIAGDTVVFTIKILAPEIIEDGGIYQIKDVKVRDIMPSGFKYQGGSWTAISSIRGDLKASLVTVDPIYAVDNAGNWLLGDMVEGEVITLTYTTKISLLQDPGLYKDLAWTSGESVLGASVYGNSDSGIFVGTEVLVVEPEGIEEGEVLGASIELPRTGAQTYLTLGALISMILGFILLVFNPKKKIGKLIIAGVLLLGVFGFIKPTPMYASTPNINVQIEQPESPTKKSSFNIGFVALDLLDRDLSVQCYKDGDIPFNPVYNGNNGNCVVDSSIISASGTYHFYVKASAGTESRNSDVVTVVVDLEKPLPVTNYVKTEGVCTYTLTFKTANDGRTSKVEIFRSSTQPFTANASTLIDTLTVGPNTAVTYADDDPLDCTKEYYYAIRALDDLGNFSSFVTDNIVTVIQGTTATTVTVNGETGEVAGEETTAGEEGEENPDQEEEDNGEVKGDEDEENGEDKDGEEDDTDETFWNKYKYVIIAAAVVALGSAGYTYVRRKK